MSHPSYPDKKTFTFKEKSTRESTASVIGNAGAGKQKPKTTKSYTREKTFSFPMKTEEVKKSSPTLSESYASHKVFVFGKSTPTTKSEKELEPKAADGSYSDKKSFPLTEPKPEQSKSTSKVYADHKTFQFGDGSPVSKKEIKEEPVTKGVPKKTSPQQLPKTKEEVKAPAVKEAPRGGNKRPVLWIVLTFFFLLTDLWLGVFLYDAHQTEVDLTKNIMNLKEEIASLQNDKLQFNDLMASKISIKGREVLRVCFSIESNQYATPGKKEILIRFITPSGEVLISPGASNTMAYKGENLDFSMQTEVMYANAEKLACADYSYNDPLVKGTYIVEIYNNEVLDGHTTFAVE